MNTKKILIPIAALIIFPLLIFSAYRISHTQSDFEVAKNLELYHSAVKNIRLYYVDDVDAAGMISESIHEFLNKLDPYTVFFSESTIEDYEFMNTGSYAGIGVGITTRNNRLFITDIYADSPAEKAGLKAGDYIKSVDGKLITEENINLLENLLQGAVGSKVKLEVERPFENNAVKTYHVERERIKDKAVSYQTLLDGDIAYVKFSVFTQHSAKEFYDALKSLKTENYKGIIIDLRDNPGGFLQEAVNLLNLFIEKDKVLVRTKGRLSQWNSVFKSSSDAVFPDLPVTVLVNNSSASASEIVAGVFQDYDRGVIIGERTFGKGLVQITKDLGYNTKIKITTAKYYLPGGRCVQALDYSHLRDDGSISIVPDSLKTPFKTAAGRIFYDGGGVKPDLEVLSVSDKKFIRFLVGEFIIHDYVTKYVVEHQTTVPSENFSFTDYADFKSYAIKAATRQNELSKYLEELADSDIAEDFDLKNAVIALKTKGESNIPRLLDENKQLVILEIEKEIVARHLGEEGLTKFSLNTDKLIEEAKKLINDEEKYKKMLLPSE